MRTHIRKSYFQEWNLISTHFFHQDAIVAHLYGFEQNKYFLIFYNNAKNLIKPTFRCIGISRTRVKTLKYPKTILIEYKTLNIIYIKSFTNLLQQEYIYHFMYMRR